MTKRAKVAIIGRMNVGKSTLFNRLTETQKAIVSSWAGTTRDVNSGSVLWRGYEFELVDTGGLDVEDDEQLEDRVIAAAHHAMQDSDLILFVVDGKAGIMPQERELAKMLRESDLPTVLVVNKMDSRGNDLGLGNDVLGLGFEHVETVSAKNGRNTGELLDVIYDLVEPRYEADQIERRTNVAIVGRPNVGKSSLLNAILGEDRVIVADKAHTTRDTNDIAYTYNDRDFLLVDTAGIRRKTKVGTKWGDHRLGAIEKTSVSASIAAMHRANVVMLVLEAHERVTAQDKKIAELAVQHGKGLVIVINKWDLVEDKDSNTIDEFAEYFDAVLPFVRWAPMVFISALEGQRVRDTLDLVVQVTENYEREIPQETLDEVLAIVRGAYKPKQAATRKYRKKIAQFKKLTQVRSRPPRLLLEAKHLKAIPKAMMDIMENELRDRAELDGVQVVIEAEEA